MARKKSNPLDTPEWHALRHEVALVRHLLGSGVTALGRASYGSKIGEYYTAFFGISVGLERLSKLIQVADRAISNNGQMPGERIIRGFGHKIVMLANVVETVTQKHRLKLTYPRPTYAISKKCLECLDAFADANRGRYANFATIDDPHLGVEEPLSKWWAEVAESIFKNTITAKKSSSALRKWHR